MLRHASADVVARDHDRAPILERVEKSHQPGGEARDGSVAHGEFASGTAEAGEIHGHRPKARGGDAF